MTKTIPRKSLLAYTIAFAFGVMGGAFVVSPLQGFQTLTQIFIKDVFGLATELAIRPIMGVDYAPGSVTYVDSSGELESVVGPPGNCVTVSGGSTTCGGTSSGGGVTGNVADGEVPSGIINGLNLTFSIAHAPNPAASLHLFRNGIRLSDPVDYKITGSAGVIIFTKAPGAGDILSADYRF